MIRISREDNLGERKKEGREGRGEIKRSLGMGGGMLVRKRERGGREEE